MPEIGDLSFSFDDGFDAGIGMLLSKPPEERIDIIHNECQILASPKTPYVICRFKDVRTFEETYNQGSSIIQDALDMISMTGHGDLITRDANDEFLAWWKSSGKRIFVIVSTATFSLKVGPIRVSVKDRNGNIVPQEKIIPKHHIGFRFFRLAQVSDDLYDAYRNMYLALECLLSSKSPKERGQKEIDWLRRSLSSVSDELSLHGLLPKECDNPINNIIDTIYIGARLPLFHAKEGNDYFAPDNSRSEREKVSIALDMLTKIVIRMAEKWFSARRIIGSANLRIIEQQYSTELANTKFVFTDNPNFSLIEPISSDTIVNGVAFEAVYNNNFLGDNRHNVFGELPISKIQDRGRMQSLYLINQDATLMSFSLDATLDLQSFDALQVYLLLRSKNANVPKYLYPR